LLLHSLRQIEWARRKAIGFLHKCYGLTDVAPGCSSAATTPWYHNSTKVKHHKHKIL